VRVLRLVAIDHHVALAHALVRHSAAAVIASSERPVCGIHCRVVGFGYGSGRDSQLLELTARLLTAKLRGQAAAGHGCRGPANSGYW